MNPTALKKETAKAERLKQMEIANAESIIHKYVDSTGFIPEYTLLEHKVYFKFTMNSGKVMELYCRYENFWKGCDSVFRLVKLMAEEVRYVG